MSENNSIVLENNTTVKATKKGRVSEVMEANKKRKKAIKEKRKAKHDKYAMDPNIVHSNFFRDQKVASWDDLKDINNKCTESLLTLGSKVVELTEGIRLMEKNYLDDFKTFNSSLNILASDMKRVSDELNETYLPVKDRSGYITNEEELMECFNIYQKMVNIVDTIDSVMMPTIFNLSSMYESAYAKFAADNAEELAKLEEENSNERKDQPNE